MHTGNDFCALPSDSVSNMDIFCSIDFRDSHDSHRPFNTLVIPFQSLGGISQVVWISSQVIWISSQMTEKLSIIYTLFPSHTNLLTIRDFHISYGSSAYGSALSVTSHDGAFQKYLT